jgi:hypothetical protein
LGAYAAADARGEGEHNQDLHYNRGIVFRYLLRYPEAIDSFARSCSIDPDFVEAKTALGSVKEFVQRVSASVASQGNLRPKEKKAMAQGIPTAASIASLPYYNFFSQ